jgi:hypothetical protein
MGDSKMLNRMRTTPVLFRCDLIAKQTLAEPKKESETCALSRKGGGRDCITTVAQRPSHTAQVSVAERTLHTDCRDQSDP